MAAVLLDTTVLIDVFRGEEGAVGRLRHLHRIGDTTYMCAVNAEELARGLPSSEAVPMRDVEIEHCPVGA